MKSTTAYLLIGNPSVGLFGAPISTFVCNAAVVLLNLVFCQRLCPISRLFQAFAKPLLASLTSALGGYGCYYLLLGRNKEGIPSAIIGILTMVLLYLLLSCALGIVAKEDILSLPKGEKIWKVLRVTRIFPQEKNK